MRAYNFASAVDLTVTADGPTANLQSSLVKPPVYLVNVNDTVTATSASPAVFSASAVPVPNGTPVILGGTTAPTGFTLGKTYWAVAANLGAKTFELSATRGGSAINSSSTGTAVTFSANINYGTGAGGQDNDDVDGTEGFQFTPGNSVVVAIQSSADHAGTSIGLQGADPSASDPTVAGAFTDLARVSGISTATQMFNVVLKQFLRYDVVADASEAAGVGAINILA